MTEPKSRSQAKRIAVQRGEDLMKINELRDLQNDRDEWRTQHENLLVMYQQAVTDLAEAKSDLSETHSMLIESNKKRAASFDELNQARHTYASTERVLQNRINELQRERDLARSDKERLARTLEQNEAFCDGVPAHTYKAMWDGLREKLTEERAQATKVREAAIHYLDQLSKYTLKWNQPVAEALSKLAEAVYTKGENDGK